MAFLIDMRVAELLASRLCHDLVGPIGAVNNGMELLEDEAPNKRTISVATRPSPARALAMIESMSDETATWPLRIIAAGGAKFVPGAHSSVRGKPLASVILSSGVRQLASVQLSASLTYCG